MKISRKQLKLISFFGIVHFFLPFALVKCGGEDLPYITVPAEEPDLTADCDSNEFLTKACADKLDDEQKKKEEEEAAQNETPTEDGSSEDGTDDEGGEDENPDTATGGATGASAPTGTTGGNTTSATGGSATAGTTTGGTTAGGSTTGSTITLSGSQLLNPQRFQLDPQVVKSMQNYQRMMNLQKDSEDQE